MVTKYTWIQKSLNCLLVWDFFLIKRLIYNKEKEKKVDCKL